MIFDFINTDTIISSDSILVDLDECKSGPNTYYKQKCSNILDVINFPLPGILNDSLSVNVINNWTNG